MGLLSWLFGGKKEDKSQWHRSSKGNLTRHLPDGDWVTVFPSDGGWKFSAPYLDDGSGITIRFSNDDSYFSPPFASEDQAKENADAYMRGESRLHESTWDADRRARDATIPEGIPRERAKLADFIAAIERYEKAKSPKPPTVHNLLERVRKRQRNATHLRNLLRERVKDPALVAQAEEILNAYPNLIARVKKFADSLPIQ